MKLYKLFIAVIIATGLLFSATSYAQSVKKVESTQTSKAKYTFKMQSHMPLENPLFLRTQRWAKLVEERSNGQIKFEFYPSSQLADPKAAFDALTAGAFQLLNTSAGLLSGKSNILGFGFQPYAFPSYKSLCEAWWEGGIREIADKVVQKKARLKVLGLNQFSGGSIISPRRITSLEDLKGLKGAGWGGELVKVTEKFGSAPVVLGPPDCYVAFERRNIDYTILPIYNLKVYHLWEVIKYVVQPPVQPTPTLFVWMNLDAWNNLPESLQKLMTDTMRESNYRDAEIISKEELEDIKWAKSKGLQFIELTPKEAARWKAAAALWDWYVEICERQGNGDEARRIVKISQSYTK